MPGANAGLISAGADTLELWIGELESPFALRHPELFSNEGNSPFPRDPDDYFYFIPPEIDPPHHRKYRNIVDPMFSPAGVIKMEGKIRQLANELIDKINTYDRAAVIAQAKATSLDKLK